MLRSSLGKIKFTGFSPPIIGGLFFGLIFLQLTFVCEHCMSAFVRQTVLIYAQIYFFIPGWIIIFTGQELSAGHVNRIAFTAGRKFYFKSKIVYSAMIALLFSILGVISLCAALSMLSLLKELTMTASVQIWLQIFLSEFCFSILLLCLVFLVKSPVIAFVVYSLWTFVEGVLFAILDRVYKNEAIWLPLHFVRLLFTTNGEAKVGNYIPLFETGKAIFLVPLVSILVILLLRRYFLRMEIKPLSD